MAGVAGTKDKPIRVITQTAASLPELPPPLLRPLAEYEVSVRCWPPSDWGSAVGHCLS